MSVNFVHGVGWQREEPDIEHEPEMKKQHISIQIPERVVCTAEEVVGFSNEYPSMIEVKIEADLLFDWSDVFHGHGSVWRWVSVHQTNLEGRNVELPVDNKTHQNGRVFLHCPTPEHLPYILQVRNQGIQFQSNELLEYTPPELKVEFNDDFSSICFDEDSNEYVGEYDLYNPFPFDLNLKVEGESVEILKRSSVTMNWSSGLDDIPSVNVECELLNYEDIFELNIHLDEEDLIDSVMINGQQLEIVLEDGFTYEHVERCFQECVIQKREPNENFYNQVNGNPEISQGQEANVVLFSFNDLDPGTYQVTIPMIILGSEFNLCSDLIISTPPVEIQFGIESRQVHNILITRLVIENNCETISLQDMEFFDLEFNEGSYRDVVYYEFEKSTENNNLTFTITFPLYDRKTIGWIDRGGSFNLTLAIRDEFNILHTHKIYHNAKDSAGEIGAIALHAPDYRIKPHVVWFGAEKNYPKNTYWCKFNFFGLGIQKLRIHQGRGDVNFVLGTRTVGNYQKAKLEKECKLGTSEKSFILEFKNQKTDLVERFSELIFIVNDKHWFKAENYCNIKDKLWERPYMPNEYEPADIDTMYLDTENMLSQIESMNELKGTSYKGKNTNSFVPIDVSTAQFDQSGEGGTFTTLNTHKQSRKTRRKLLEKIRELENEIVNLGGELY